MKEQNDMKGKKEMEETHEGNEGKEGNEGREGNEGNMVDKGGALGIVISMVVNLAGVPRTSTMLSKHVSMRTCITELGSETHVSPNKRFARKTSKLMRS